MKLASVAITEARSKIAMHHFDRASKSDLAIS